MCCLSPPPIIMSSPSNTSLKSEKGASAGAAKVSQVDDTPEVNEVFGGVGEDGVDFRSVGWIKTSLILLKCVCTSDGEEAPD